MVYLREERARSISGQVYCIRTSYDHLNVTALQLIDHFLRTEILQNTVHENLISEEQDRAHRYTRMAEQHQKWSFLFTLPFLSGKTCPTPNLASAAKWCQTASIVGVKTDKGDGTFAIQLIFSRLKHP